MRVYAASAGSGPLEREPRNWTSAGVGSSAYMEDLEWRGWGRRTATGTGTASNNDCEPSCAAGTRHYQPGKLVLSRPRRCGRSTTRRVYTRAVYKRLATAEVDPFQEGPGWHRTVFRLPRRPSCKLSDIEKAGAPVAPNRVYYDGAYQVQPAAMSTDPLGVYDETSYRAEGLTWQTWGTTATASGPITHCVTEYRPCETQTGTVELGGLQRYGCDFSILAFEAYSRIRFRVQRSDGLAETPWIALPPDQQC